MNPWEALGGRACAVRRRHDWQQLLGAYPDWHRFLAPEARPDGLRFLADFGAGEREYELAQDSDGFVAVSEEGVHFRRLNSTEAEFARLELEPLLRQVLPLRGPTQILAPGLFSAGIHSVSERQVAVFVALRSLSRLTSIERQALEPSRHRARASLILMPSVERSGSEREGLVQAKVAIGQLPLSPPWGIDWSPLVEEARFDVPLIDPNEVFASRYAVIVDQRQERIWLEGTELDVRAGSHPYHLFSHLAERPRVKVPRDTLANGVLNSRSQSEAELLKGVKNTLTQAIRKCLQGKAGIRFDPAKLISVDQGRFWLEAEASLVKVIPPLSHHESSEK